MPKGTIVVRKSGDARAQLEQKAQRKVVHLRLHGKRSEQARENANALARLGSRRGNVGVYDFGLPSLKDAPYGARVVDGGGPHAVALCHNGYFIGLFRRP